MQAELKKAWIEALRSGRYAQGHQYLRSTGEHYCCLGVLVNVACPKAWQVDPIDDVYYYVDDNPEILTSDVCSQVGLSYDAMKLLCEMNDGQARFKERGSLCFLEIADWIEANVPEALP